MTQEQQQTISKVQEIVNEMLQHPQYAQYVRQHKLSLIDSRFRDIDRLLDAGTLKTN